MAEKKNERLKLILVFGLSVVLAVSVYFRFIRAKASTATAAPTLIASHQPMTVPQVQVKGDGSRTEDRETPLLGPGVPLYGISFLPRLLQPLRSR